LGGTIGEVKQYRTTNPEDQTMTDGGPRRPDESERDYMKRLAEHLAEIEKNRRRIKRGDPRADLSGDIAAVHADDQLLDNLGAGGKGKGDDLSQLLGAWNKDINSEPLAPFLDKDSAADLVKFQASKNPKLRKKLAKKNKTKWKEAAKKNKKSKGCAVIAVALLGAGGGALYGLFEAGRTIVSALGY